MTEKIIRAIYSEQTVRVYQAFSPDIAYPALMAGRFVPPFRMTRMTWIKPSFYWMMYRSGYGTKPGQTVVLGIDITREGFDWALSNGVPSTYSPARYATVGDWQSDIKTKPVRIQWDPERDWRLCPVPNVRAIQIGLSGEAITRYVNEWITAIEDLTPAALTAAQAAVSASAPPQSPASFERPYPTPPSIAAAISNS